MFNIKKLRKEYHSKSLDFIDINHDPFEQFKLWLNDAIQAEVGEPTAMVLATATHDAKPSCRTVLLKEIEDRGFLFFTNYQSQKGQEIEENPYAAANFLWKELERQVILSGFIEKTTSSISEQYFYSRPRQSQISVWASNQGKIIKSREELEKKFFELENKFNGENIPYPSYWGGYRLIPERFEFWQGRPNRLHDRFQFIKVEDRWMISRLSP